MKYIELQDFAEKGYLQEVNRRLLNILGISMEFVEDEDGNLAYTRFVDFRDDSEGIVLGDIDIDQIVNVQKELDAKIEARQAAFGWFLQPYNVDSVDED